MPNEQHPQPGADFVWPDTINPLEDRDIQAGLDWLQGNYPAMNPTEEVLTRLVFKLWQHIQRHDGAWRIQQDRLIALEERLKEVERWQDDADSYSLEQNEYEV